jgi:hypothetical protein
MSIYENLMMIMEVEREGAWIIFLKLFLAPYLAFVITYFGHFISEERADFRI